MAVALVASSTSGTTDAQTSSRTVPVPAGAASGHVAVIDLEIWLDTSTDPTITWPAGFTQIGYVESTTDGFTRLYRALKVLTGADSGNYSMSWSGSYWNQAQATLWSGVNGTTPQDVATASAVTASNTSHAAPSLTTGNAGCGMLFSEANENSSTSTPPTGYTEQQEANYLKTNTKIAGAAGSETISGGAHSVSTVKVGLLTALRPAGGGGGSTAANPALETDTAQPAGRTRSTTTQPATEVDAAQPASRTRTTTGTPAAETDTAQPAGRIRTTTAGTAAEADTAQPITSTRTTVAGAAAEVDTAPPIGSNPVTPAGPGLETDTAQPAGHVRATPAAAAEETGVALPAGRVRVTGTLPAAEVDSAQPAGSIRATAVLPAVELDTAQPVGGAVSDLLLIGEVESQWHAEVERGRFLAEVEPR